MSAREIRCPRCGGSVDEQARRCKYCDARVATVRCSSCFHMNVPDAAHCSGCGRDLGLEPIPQGDDLQCPDCKEPFTSYRAGPGVLRDCGRCGGQFVEHGLLRDLLQQREVYGVTAPRRAPRSVPVSRVRYVPCPVCAQLMNRQNFAGTSGVILDVCRLHGSWFDQGELPRVLAFAESGQLARARERDEEERKQALQQQRAAVAMSEMGPGSSTFGPPSRLELGVSDLLDFVVDLLTRR